MALSTECWSDRSLTRTGDAWTARRGWKVTGATSEEQALNANAAPGEDRIPNDNDSHPQNSALKVRSRTVTRPNYGVWKVVVDYAIPASGGDFTVFNNKLSEKPRLSWRSGYIELPVDRDLRNRTIANAAGDALDPPPLRRLKVKYLTITRYEPYYDLDFLSRFEDTVNATDITIAGTKFLAGNMHITTIEPAEEYPSNLKDTNTPWVKMAYNFEIIQVWFLNESGVRTALTQPFQRYVKNVGQRSWYKAPDNKTYLGEIYLKSQGSQITTPVALGATGKPLDVNMRVSSDGLTFYEPIDNPYAAEPALFVDETRSNKAMKILRFDEVYQAEFLQLGL